MMLQRDPYLRFQRAELNEFKKEEFDETMIIDSDLVWLWRKLLLSAMNILNDNGSIFVNNHNGSIFVN